MSTPPPEAEATAGRLRAALRLRRRKNPWDFMRDFPRIWPYLRPYWKLGVVSTATVGLGTLVALLSPWPLAILVDTVLGDKPLPSILTPFVGDLGTYGLLIFAVLAGLGLALLESGLAIFDNYASTTLKERMVLDFRSDLFRHAQRLSLGFHDEKRTGALMYQINNQAKSIGQITLSVPPLAQNLLTLLGMFLVTYRIDAQLALVALGVVPFIYYSTGYYANRIEPKLRQVRGLEAQSLAIVHESMAMLRVILAFGRERHEFGRFRAQGETAVDARIKLTVRQTAFSLTVNMITAVGTALVLAFGGYKVLQGDLTVGELLVVIGYVAAIYAPISALSSTVTTLQENFVGFRHALDLLQTDPEVREAPDAVPVEAAAGTIVFDNLSFSYPERTSTLTGVDFRAEAGESIAVVGPTGAGKSTLVSLIPRFYDPTEGRILLDGVDIRTLTLESLRAQISIVLQDPILFSGTIADNIRYGKLDATDEEVIAAAEAANAHDFVTKLRAQYETRLGERGAKLSGGERQRIAIARAFIKDAPILILDEPTSSIDLKTEEVILDALDRLMAGRTSFMIAHRLATVRSADWIVVLEGGRIVQQGTHDGLVSEPGLYRRLWNAQRGAKRRPGQPRGARELLTAQFTKNLRRSGRELSEQIDGYLGDSSRRPDSLDIVQGNSPGQDGTSTPPRER